MCPVIAADAAPATPGSKILTQNVKFVRQSLGKFRPVRGVSFSELEDGECPGTRARDVSTTVSLAAMPLLTMTNIFPNSALRISGPCLPVCLFEWANFTHLAVYL